jgi:twitching motility protein PilT
MVLQEFCDFVAKAYALRVTDICIREDIPARIRLGGKLAFHDSLFFSGEKLRALAGEMLSEREGEFLSATRSVRGIFEINEDVKIRFNFCFCRSGLNFFARLLPAALRTWSCLNIPEMALSFLQKKQGLILISGPLCSGKTSTMASFIAYLNQIRREHIIYIDEQIEYKIRSQNCIVNLRQLRRDTSCTTTALKFALRQDPDIVVIGDICEPEIASFALNIAETGHLVIAGTSTVGAVNTIARMLHLFPPKELSAMRMKLAAYLIGVISQVLVPNLDKTDMQPLFEVATITPSIANSIREDWMAQLRSEMSRSVKGSLITFDDYAQELKQKGLLPKAFNMKSFLN